MIENALTRLLSVSPLNLERLTADRIGAGLVAVAGAGLVITLAGTYQPEAFSVSFPSFETASTTPVEIAVVPETALRPPGPVPAAAPVSSSAAASPLAQAQVPSAPAASAPAAKPIEAVLAPAMAGPVPAIDRRELILRLQRGLAAAGCYDGRAHGAWTSSSRRAMQAFLVEANATLPVDRPDPALLSLLESNPRTRCGNEGPNTPPLQREAALEAPAAAGQRAPAAEQVATEGMTAPPPGFQAVTPSAPVEAAPSERAPSPYAQASADDGRGRKRKNAASSPAKIAKKFLRSLDRALSSAF